MTKKYKTIFLGTPNFSVFSLKKLINSDDFLISAVFTQKDKVKGRGKKLSFSPVKEIALKNNLTIYQPEKIKEDLNLIQKIKPDIIVVVAYGQILPESILNIPKYGCINLHASLLPLYRGASCISAPILNNDKYTGVSIMKMDKGMDTGDIISQATIKLSSKETANELHDKLAKLGAKILVPCLKDYLNGKLKPKKQDDSKASYVKLTEKSDGKINWQEPAIMIERKIRAYHPWPGTYCFLRNNQRLKIHQAKISQSQEKLEIGELSLKNKEILVGTGQANLSILKLQLAGQKSMLAPDFINGNKIKDQILK
jgi:methionyl-tRNA formyltransferase